MRDLAEIFERFETDAGVVGIAFGAKETEGAFDPDTDAIAFIVDTKLPLLGAARRLEDGRRRIPNKVELGNRTIASDVVSWIEPRGTKVIKQSSGGPFHAGGQISNLSATGTYGCLVRKQGDQFVQAVTNRHVAIGANNVVFFPNASSPDMIEAFTVEDVDLIADEQFIPFQDEPNTYVDVDAAIVTIPQPDLAKFSVGIPTIGVPTAFHRPAHGSLADYKQSLVGRQVVSWSWNSGRREGQISHVLYTTRRGTGGPLVTYSFLVEGKDGTVPGLARDSGKAWTCTGPGGEVEVVGLHQGEITKGPTLSRFAVATEFWSLSELMQLSPYTG